MPGIARIVAHFTYSTQERSIVEAFVAIVIVIVGGVGVIQTVEADWRGSEAGVLVGMGLVVLAGVMAVAAVLTP